MLMFFTCTACTSLRFPFLRKVSLLYLTNKPYCFCFCFLILFLIEFPVVLLKFKFYMGGKIKKTTFNLEGIVSKFMPRFMILWICLLVTSKHRFRANEKKYTNWHPFSGLVYWQREIRRFVWKPLVSKTTGWKSVFRYMFQSSFFLPKEKDNFSFRQVSKKINEIRERLVYFYRGLRKFSTAYKCNKIELLSLSLF